MKNTGDIKVTPDTSFAQHFHVLHNTCSSLDISTNILHCILCVSFKTVTLILLFPYEQVNGSPVPTIIFKGLPSTFHAFLLSVVMAFSGAFNALMLATNRPKIAKFCSHYSMAFMASAVVLLIWAVLQTVCNLDAGREETCLDVSPYSVSSPTTSVSGGSITDIPYNR